MTATKSAFELHLEKLRGEYLKQLPDKIKKIETDWRSLQTTWQLDLITVFHRDVHSLIGTSGTFGFMDISTRARELEVILKPLEHTSEDFMLEKALAQEITTKIKTLTTLVEAL